MRRKSEVGGHRSADRRVAAAKGVLEPEAASAVPKKFSLGKFPKVRGENRVAVEHLVQDAALEGFPEDEDDAVGSLCAVCFCGSAPVGWMFGVGALEFFGQKGVQVAQKLVRDFVIVPYKLKCFFGGNVKNGCCQRMLAEREPHIDLCSEKGNGLYSARPGEKQHERNHRKNHPERKKGNGQTKSAKDRFLLFTGKDDGNRNEPCDIERKQRKPSDRSLEVATEGREGRGIGDVRQVKIGPQKRIGEPLVRKPKNLVIDNGDKKVEDKKDRKRTRLFEKREQGTQNEDGAVGHGQLPNCFPGKHLRKRKPERVGQRIKENEHGALQQNGEQGYRNKRIHKIPGRRPSECST